MFELILDDGSSEIERCLISTFQVAESMGFKDEFRQREDILSNRRLIML